MAMAKFVLFLILAVPGQKQPATHVQDMDSLEDCLSAAHQILDKATEKHQLLQAGCITVPNAGTDN